MQSSKQFQKLPKAAQLALTRLTGPALFIELNKSINTQHTSRSKFVRRSIFRGLLRKYFNYSDDDLKPIEASNDEKQAYHDSGIISRQSQTESGLNILILQKIIAYPLFYLLCTSGLRIDELLTNLYKFDTIGKKKSIFFILNKKLTSNFYPIVIVGSFLKWKRKFLDFRKSIIGVPSINIINQYNIILKSIIPDNFYKRSTHICRGIYVLLIKRLLAPTMTMPNLIEKYLHHESANPSVHYQNLIFDKVYSKAMLNRLIRMS